MNTAMNISDGRIERDLEPVRSLLNEVIASSTALYDYHPRPVEQVRQWMSDKLALGLPLRIARGADDRFLGFATFGAFRPHPAYKYTAEHSVYVSPDARGQGIGKALLLDIIERATEHDIHVLIGAIDADNSSSVSLHSSLGFTHCGTIQQAGFKFGRWLDLALFQKQLAAPLNPVDG